MAAKNRKKGRVRTRRDRDAPDIPPSPHDVLMLHMQASKRRDELLGEARDLQAAGKISAARKVLAEAEEIQRRLHALEAWYRPQAPKSSTTPSS